jgi:hypothetical protein
MRPSRQPAALVPESPLPLAEQIREAMDRKGMSFSALPSSMGTSRTVLYRLLDPSDTGMTLDALSRVAR